MRVFWTKREIGTLVFWFVVLFLFFLNHIHGCIIHTNFLFKNNGYSVEYL